MSVEIKKIKISKKPALAAISSVENGYVLRTVVKQETIRNMLNLHEDHVNILRKKGYHQIDYEHYTGIKNEEELTGIINQLKRPAKKRRPTTLARLHAILAVPAEFPFSGIPEIVQYTSGNTVTYNVALYPVLRQVARKTHLLYIGVNPHKHENFKFPRAVEFGDFKYSLAGIGVTTIGGSGDHLVHKDGRIKLTSILKRLSKMRSNNLPRKARTTAENAKSILSSLKKLETIAGKNVLYTIDRILAGAEAEILHIPAIPSNDIEVLKEHMSPIKAPLNRPVIRAVSDFVTEISKDIFQRVWQSDSDIPEIAAKYGAVWTADRIVAAEVAAKKFLDHIAQKKENTRDLSEYLDHARKISYFLAGIPLNADPSLYPPKNTWFENGMIRSDIKKALKILYDEKMPFVNPAAIGEQGGTYALKYTHMHSSGQLLRFTHRRISKWDLHPINTFKIGENAQGEHNIALAVDKNGFVYLLGDDVLLSLHHLIGRKIHADSQKEFLGIFVADTILNDVHMFAQKHAKMYNIPVKNVHTIPSSQRDIAVDAAYILAHAKMPELKRKIEVSPNVITNLAEEYAKELIQKHTTEFVRLPKEGKNADFVDLLLKTNDAIVGSKDLLKKMAKSITKGMEIDDKPSQRNIRQILQDMHGITMVAYLSQHYPLLPEDADNFLSQIAKQKILPNYWEEIVDSAKLIADPAVVGATLPIYTRAEGPNLGANKNVLTEVMKQSKIDRMAKTVLSLYIPYVAKIKRKE